MVGLRSSINPTDISFKVHRIVSAQFIMILVLLVLCLSSVKKKISIPVQWFAWDKTPLYGEQLMAPALSLVSWTVGQSLTDRIDPRVTEAVFEELDKTGSICR